MCLFIYLPNPIFFKKKEFHVGMCRWNISWEGESNKIGLTITLKNSRVAKSKTENYVKAYWCKYFYYWSEFPCIRCVTEDAVYNVIVSFSFFLSLLFTLNVETSERESQYRGTQLTSSPEKSWRKKRKSDRYTDSVSI